MVLKLKLVEGMTKKIDGETSNFFKGLISAKLRNFDAD